MSKSIFERIHIMIDDLMVCNPGQFPDGPQFLHGLEFFLQALAQEGSIDQWSINPMAKEGFRVIVENDGIQTKVVRTPDGGRQP